MPNKVNKPVRKPVVLNAEPIVEPVFDASFGPVVNSTHQPVEVIGESEPKHEPVFKPVYFKVKALGWYNNGNLIDTPWMPGEVRKVTPELFKRLKNDLPDNWETV